MTEHETLAAALAAFQAALPAVKKSATGQVPGNRTYKYADLGDVTAAVLPALAQHGLSWMAMPAYTEHGQFVLRYELLHTSGESRTGEYPLPEGDPQKIGSALTYARRYTLCSATGVVADEDDDGRAASGAVPEPRGQNRQGQRQSKPKTSEAEEARNALLSAVERNQWEAARVAQVFQTQTGTDIRECTDAAVIRNFTQALVKDPDHVLGQPAGSAS